MPRVPQSSGTPRPIGGIERFRAARVLLMPLLVAASACTVGPDYEPPQTDAPPPAWVGAELPDSVRFPEEGPEARWWAAFGDPTLTELIERAVAANLRLAGASARVREARALIGVAESGLLPVLGTAAAYDRARLSERTPILEDFIDRGAVDTSQELFSAGFDASWELDVFGGDRRAVQAAEARAGGAAADRRDVLLTVVAEVARNYFELRGSQAELAALEESLELRRETLRLVERKHESGLATRADVVRARGEAEALAARLPPQRAAIAAGAFRLAVLTATPPAETWRSLAEPGSLPAGPEAVPVGLPGELLRRRPDIRAAERGLAAASAEIGVAVSELYPSFSLTGTAAVQAQDFPALFNAGSAAWVIGPSIRWPVFQGGRIRANIAAAEARHEAALLDYRRTVLAAVADVETSLTRYATAYLAAERLRETLSTQEEAVALARRAYEAGLGDLLNVLDAQRRLTETRRELARSRTRVLVGLASLNKALGGGWPEAAPARPGR